MLPDHNNNNNMIMMITSFCIYLGKEWKYITLYLVSKETSSILTAMVQLIVFEDNEDVI